MSAAAFRRRRVHIRASYGQETGVDTDAGCELRGDDEAMAATVVESRKARSVEDAMTAGVIHCTPDTPLRGVARLMACHGIHAVYVFDYGVEDDETTTLWGVVTDIDLAAAWPVLDQRSAGDSAVTPLVTISSTEPLGLAAGLMAESGSSHLVVVDSRTRRPVGVLSSLDLARVLAAPLADGGT
jgi:CBS domain-containing protein